MGSKDRIEGERGQVLVYMVIILVELLGMAAFAIDVGYGYFGKRTLQSQADAAALAGAQGLPATSTATTLAQQYSGSTGGKNAKTNLTGVQTAVTFKCAFAGTTCSSPTAIQVAETGQVNTFFARVFGINTMNIGARATACIGGWNAAYLIPDGSSDSCIAQPGPCVLPYPTSGTRGSIVFNESEVLRAANTDPGPTGSVRTIDMFYNDEHALTLGVRQVAIKTKTGTTTTTSTTNYPIAPLNSNPGSAVNPALGTTASSGDQAGNDISGRPMYPALFITDITQNPNSMAGDWQNFGTPVAPNAVFGTWKGAVVTIDKTKSPSTVTVTPDADPSKNNWNLGTGSDPVPGGLTNEGYGAEVRWDATKLGLVPGHAYRFQVMVHDGDQNKSGGDSGEACLAAVWPG